MIKLDHVSERVPLLSQDIILITPRN